MDLSQSMWEFKYAPRSVDELILPNRYIDLFKRWISNQMVDNSLFVSHEPGSGKTSVAKIIINSKIFSTLFINASRETSIDNVRNNIKNFVKTVSISNRNSPKVVILDEADRLSAQALDALKGEIEAASKNARFIFTANRKSAFPKPIKSRLNEFDFDQMFSENKREMWTKGYERMKFILESEGIEFDYKTVGNIIKRFAPDWRNIIRILQLMSAFNNEITKEDFSSLDVTTNLTELIDLCKENEFQKIREFCVKNIGNEMNLVRGLFTLTKSVEMFKSQEDAAMLIINLADFEEKILNVPDLDIYFTGLILKISKEVKFR